MCLIVPYNIASKGSRGFQFIDPRTNFYHSLGEVLSVSTYNSCFHGEVRNISVLFDRGSTLSKAMTSLFETI